MATTSPLTTPTRSDAIDREEDGTPDGRFEAPADLRLRPSRSRIRFPWIVLGVLLVVGSGLTFSVWASGADHRIGALAVATDLEAGHRLGPDDLTTVGIGSDTDLNLIPPDALDDAVGQTLRVKLSAGTLLTGDVLSDGSVVDAGNALVSVSLPPEALPVGRLGSGDAVMAVETPGVDIPVDTAPVLPRVWPATVFSVTDVETFEGSATVVASLEVDPFSAAEIAAAAAADRIRLVVVHSIDDIPPGLLLGGDADPATLSASSLPPDASAGVAEKTR